MALEVLLKMKVGVMLWNMRVWVGIRVGRVGFGEVGRVGCGGVYKMYYKIEQLLFFQAR